jgi:hypothetical protein
VADALWVPGIIAIIAGIVVLMDGTVAERIESRITSGPIKPF